ncbi:hypothetical protein ACU61A_37975 [Pseudonocardia sichuanensis]
MRRRRREWAAATCLGAAALTLGITDLPWFPVAGTATLPRQPLDALQSGMADHVPMIAGSTRDEMRSLVLVRLGDGSAW